VTRIGSSRLIGARMLNLGILILEMLAWSCAQTKQSLTNDLFVTDMGNDELTWSRRADGEVVAKGQGLASLAVDKLDRSSSGQGMNNFDTSITLWSLEMLVCTHSFIPREFNQAFCSDDKLIAIQPCFPPY